MNIFLELALYLSKTILIMSTFTFFMFVENQELNPIKFVIDSEVSQILKVHIIFRLHLHYLEGKIQFETMEFCWKDVL